VAEPIRRVLLPAGRTPLEADGYAMVCTPRTFVQYPRANPAEPVKWCRTKFSSGCLPGGDLRASSAFQNRTLDYGFHGSTKAECSKL
jgi:hypothetical protein